ncbi:MAG: hypothetical protein NTY48_01820, partial [Candidatus Diapherotrites archaeon]|nr:hypothetical protein [Candidatus Diapherotrites archaeon]
GNSINVTEQNSADQSNQIIQKGQEGAILPEEKSLTIVTNPALVSQDAQSNEPTGLFTLVQSPLSIVSVLIGVIIIISLALVFRRK